MELTVSQIAAIASILLASSILQGTVGFAAGLFGIPLLLMAGIALPDAIAIILVASTVQSAIGAYELFDHIVPRETLRTVAIRLLTMPLGIYVLWLTDSLHQQEVKQIIGVVLLGIVVVHWLWRVQPRARLHPGWELLAASTSGFMGGFCGMGGPPIVLWVMAHDWSAAKSRGYLFFVFLSSVPLQVMLLAWAFGSRIFWPVLIGALGILFVLSGTAIGLRIGANLPKWRLRQIAYLILTVIAIGAIVAPLLPGPSAPNRQASQVR